MHPETPPTTNGGVLRFRYRVAQSRSEPFRAAFVLGSALGKTFALALSQVSLLLRSADPNSPWAQADETEFAKCAKAPDGPSGSAISSSRQFERPRSTLKPSTQ